MGFFDYYGKVVSNACCIRLPSTCSAGSSCCFNTDCSDCYCTYKTVTAMRNCSCCIRVISSTTDCYACKVEGSIAIVKASCEGSIGLSVVLRCHYLCIYLKVLNGRTLTVKTGKLPFGQRWRQSSGVPLPRHATLTISPHC